MLQNPVALERRCPRRWSMFAACGLLSVAIVAAGVTLKASAAPAPEPKQEAPSKDQPKAEQPTPPPAVPGAALPNLDDLLKDLPSNLDPDQAKAIRQQMKQVRKQMQRLMEMQPRQGLPGVGLPLNPAFAGGAPQNGRLGVVVERPSDTLADQLELPNDQGLIVREVAPDSAAAKAGIKAHDILLEVAGKPVSSNPEEFRTTLAGIKADKPVDVVVLRKGRKETIKGLSLPEAKAAVPALNAPLFNPVNPLNPAPVPILPPNFPNVNLAPGAGGGNSATTTTARTNDQFTTRSQEGNLTIMLIGKVENGKAKVSQISIQDGGESNTYDSLDKVPEKYRDKVSKLVEMSEKGSVHVDVKAP